MHLVGAVGTLDELLDLLQEGVDETGPAEMNVPVGAASRLLTRRATVLGSQPAN